MTNLQRELLAYISQPHLPVRGLVGHDDETLGVLRVRGTLAGSGVREGGTESDCSLSLTLYAKS